MDNSNKLTNILYEEEQNMKRNGLKLFFIIAASGIFLGMSSVGHTEVPIKIGATLGLTGPYGVFGVGLQHGILFAEHKINEAGGVLGRKLEVTILDNESQPALANTTARRLIELEKVCVIFPAPATPVANAVAPVCEEFKVPMIAIYSGDPKLHIPVRPFIFQYFPDAISHSNAFGVHLKRLGIHKITLLYIDNAWGRAVKDLMIAEEFKKRYGLEFIADPMPVSGDVKDLTVQVNRLKSYGSIEAVLFAPNTLVVTAFLKARKNANWEIPIFVMGPHVDEALFMLGVEDHGHNAWQGAPYDSTGTLKAISRTVVDEGIKYFGKKKWVADDCFGSGYDGVMIAAEAIKRAGSIDPQKIRDSLENNLEGWGKDILLGGNAETVVHWTPKYHGGLQANEVVWKYWVKGKANLYK
jgi:branched-chain amino acid transport system substrate-binding protein